MLVCCPHCQSEIDVDDSHGLTHVDCRICGSTFERLPDETIDFPESKVATSIAHFELIKKIGVGAHGIVWQARDTKLDRPVALKIPRRDRLTPGEIERFLREARAAAQLNHPNIVSVHDAGRDGDAAYIAADFIEGEALSTWLIRRKPNAAESAELVAAVSDGLHHAHEQGIVHRDIKPSNIMIDARGEPYIMDFGLAKREATDATISVEGFVMGTPAYMSPEQALGKANEADRRSDVYSLGVILFQLLTAELPFRGNEQMLIQQVIDTDAPHLRKLNPNIPQDLDTICLKCLEKSPQRRYQTASDLANELRRYLRGEPISARPITRTSRVWRWCHRNPVISGLAGALLLSMIIGLAGITTQWLRANEHARRAVASAQSAKRSADSERRAHQQTGQYLYVAHMNMAQQAYELADPARVTAILNRHRPGQENEIDRRSFEWYYWWRQAHRWSKQLDHRAAVNTVAISSDGDTIATGGDDHSIVLWDAVSGAARTKLQGHTKAVFALAFSPVANVLVSGGRDDTIRFWDASSGKEIAAIEAGCSVFSLSFTADGKTLASAGSDLSVRLWDVETRQEVRLLTGHFDFVYSVAFSPDGKLVASAGLDRIVRLWDRESGEIIYQLAGHVLEVWSVAFSPDGKTLGSGSADKTVRLWDVESGEPLATLDGHTDRVRSIIFAPDGKTLASASHDRSVRLWNMNARSQPLEVPQRNVNRSAELFYERLQLPNDDFPKDTLIGHAGRVSSLAISQNGRTLVSGGLDGVVNQWNVSQLQEKSTLRKHEKTINSLAVTADGRTMISGSNDRTAQLWDLVTMQPTGPPIEHAGWVLAVSLSSDGKWYATGCYDGTVRLGSLSGGEPIVLTGHQKAVSAVAFSPDGRLLATGSHDNTVRLWDVETGQHQATYTRHTGRVQGVAFLSRGGESGQARLVSAGSDLSIHVWDAPSMTQVHQFVGHQEMIWSVAVSPDDKLVASAGADESVKLWDLTTGKLVSSFDGHAETVRCVAFSPDGKTLVSGSDDKTIKLWDIIAGEPKGTLKGHDYRIWSVVFTPNGRRLISSSLAIRIWNGTDE